MEPDDHVIRLIKARRAQRRQNLNNGQDAIVNRVRVLAERKPASTFPARSSVCTAAPPFS
ncbi:MAG: hypothetical protein M1435_02225 [Actinobacteria bacterium]|jgi:hypothetical protein|nr:hypothetical protein [Actinomycetota bacterium]MDA8303234.1 hypothetical protein [Actinomycetota bacterium]